MGTWCDMNYSMCLCTLEGMIMVYFRCWMYPSVVRYCEILRLHALEMKNAFRAEIKLKIARFLPFGMQRYYFTVIIRLFYSWILVYCVKFSYVKMYGYPFRNNLTSRQTFWCTYICVVHFLNVHKHNVYRTKWPLKCNH